MSPPPSLVLSILAVVGIWPSVVSTAILPIVQPQAFDVSIHSMSLMDTDRIDPFANDGRPRSIMVSSFNPVASCGQKLLEPYMPPNTAAFQDDKYAAYGLPNGSFQSLQVESCQGVTKRTFCSTGSTPLVLFSGALSTSRLLYTSILQSISAAGYLVVSIDHPYDADIVDFPNGTMILGAAIESDAEIELALQTRAEDISFVRRQMANITVNSRLFPGHGSRQPAPRTAVLGHSLGGAVAAAAMLEDASISAGINLDGSMFGSVLTAGLDRPFMLMGHENKTQATDPSWKAIWPQLREWKKEFEVRDTAHYSFSDLPLITSVLDLQDKLPAEIDQVLGTIEGHRMTELVVAYTVGFLDMVFKSGSAQMLGGINAKYPEVVDVA